MTIISFTVSGVVAPVYDSFGTIYGFDNGGIFGPAGAGLGGQNFTVTWTGIDCNCFGNQVNFNPIIDAVLTINNHSYDFGAGIRDRNDFTNDLQQVQTLQPDFLSLTTHLPGAGIIPGHDGAFLIHPCCDSRLETQAFLTISVPAPIMGAELPGLLAALIIFGGFYWKRRTAVGARRL